MQEMYEGCPCVIDAHVHLYPDSIAQKVVPMLSGRFGNAPSFAGTIECCKAKDDVSGIVLSLNLPVATKSDSVRHTNEFWSKFSPLSSSRAGEGEIGRSRAQVVSLACFHPQVKNKKEELEKIVELGFTGVKFHPEYQNFRFNDSCMDETWALMSELGLVAYLHAGGERVFPPPYRSSPGDIALLKKRFPNLEIVAAHLGGFGMWNEAEREIIGLDVYLDLSHTFFWMGEEQILRMVKNHGASRILFGSDAPWQDPAEVLKAFMALDLSEEERLLILCENARRLFRL